MKIVIPENPKPRVEMLPLIDVVFLLLVVFIYTMISMAVHYGMPVSLPDAAGVSPEKNAVLSVSIDQDHRLYINKMPVDMAVFAQALKTAAQEEKTRTVLLFADKQISYQFLFSVLDQIRLSGLSQISLQAHPDFLKEK